MSLNAGNWAKDFSLQPTAQTAKELSTTQDVFANQEQNSKYTEKNLNNLYQASAKLCERNESLRDVLNDSVKKAFDTLHQLPQVPSDISSIRSSSSRRESNGSQNPKSSKSKRKRASSSSSAISYS